MKYILKDLFGIDTLPADEDKDAHIAILQDSMIELEGFYHGKTSGIDIKTVLRGGLCYFTENLKICESINMWSNEDCVEQNQNGTIKLLLVDTCVTGSTKQAVENVKKYLETLPDNVAAGKMSDIGQITERIKAELEEPKFNLKKDLGELIELNHKKLDELGICIEQNHKIVSF